MIGHHTFNDSVRTFAAAFSRGTPTTRLFGVSRPGSQSSSFLELNKSRALTEEVMVDDVEADEEGSLVHTAVKSNALAELMNRASKIHWENLF